MQLSEALDRVARQERRQQERHWSREERRWQEGRRLMQAGWRDVRSHLEDTCAVSYRVSGKYVQVLARTLPPECRQRGPNLARSFGSWNWYRLPPGAGADLLSLVDLALAHHRRDVTMVLTYWPEETVCGWGHWWRRVYGASPEEREALRALLALG
jgi:hypothetical protein